MTPTKKSIKAAYIDALQKTYPFYTEGSRPLAMAENAADKALSGVMRLEGDCWSAALVAHGLKPSVTLKALKALPL